MTATSITRAKLSLARAIEWRRKKLGIPKSKLAAAAEVDRARLSRFLAGDDVEFLSGAIERLMDVLSMGVTYNTAFTVPESLLPSPPGPAPTPEPKKKRTRPNNKPR